MRIRHVTITVPDPSETASFLATTLGFPLKHLDDRISLSIGPSFLSLVEGSMEPNGYYHLAFDIPENAVHQAHDLLSASTQILQFNGSGVTTGAPVWNSHSVYFNAPGSLNLELIGRHRLRNAIDRPFAFTDISRISEVGIAVEDTFAAALELQERMGLAPFGEPTDTFAPMGSDDGLLVLVKHGRIWFPTADQTTTRRPLGVEVEGFRGNFSLGTTCTVKGT